MSKIDTIFKEIISDKELVEAFGYNPSAYTSIAQGSKSTNKYVRAIANMLIAYDKKVEEVGMDMRIKGQTGKIVIEDNVKDSIYRRLVKDLE